MTFKSNIHSSIINYILIYYKILFDFQVFSHVTTARPNLPRPPSLAELHLPRPPQLGNCFPKRSETDPDSKFSGLQAHLANIQPPTLGGKFQSLKSLGSSQASSSTGITNYNTYC